MFARSTGRFSRLCGLSTSWRIGSSILGQPVAAAPCSGPPQLQHLLRIPVRHGFHHKQSATRDLSVARVMWNKMFGKYLLATNIISSGILMVVGDVMAQELEYRRGASNAKRYDFERIGRMFIVGALQGPLHHYVYNWMDKVMPIQNTRNTLWKILIDQVVMSPACIFIFFYAACFLEHKSIKDTNCELKDKFGYIYLFDWMVWPAVQYVNFRYLDTKYRVMFVNVCTALYNVFMSYMKHDFALDL